MFSSAFQPSLFSHGGYEASIDFWLIFSVALVMVSLDYLTVLMLYCINKNKIHTRFFHYYFTPGKLRYRAEESVKFCHGWLRSRGPNRAQNFQVSLLSQATNQSSFKIHKLGYWQSQHQKLAIALQYSVLLGQSQIGSNLEGIVLFPVTLR